MTSQAIGMRKQILQAYGNNKTWIAKVDEMEEDQIMATYFTIRKSNKLWWQKKKCW